MGIGLIESLVAVSLFAILSVVAGGILFTTMRSRSKALTTKELRESGSSAVLAIEDYLKRHVGKPTACSFVDNNSIEMDGVDEGGTTIFQCNVDGRIASNSALLTPASVRCSAFKADCQPSSTGYPVITIDFDLEISSAAVVAKELNTAPGVNKQHFSTTVTLKQKI